MAVVVAERGREDAVAHVFVRVVHRELGFPAGDGLHAGPHDVERLRLVDEEVPGGLVVLVRDEEVAAQGVRLNAVARGAVAEELEREAERLEPTQHFLFALRRQPQYFSVTSSI